MLRTNKKRRAYTIVEVLIAAVIATMIISALWTLVSLSFRAGHSADKKLQTGQAFMLLQEHLNADFTRLHVSSGHGVEVADDKIGFWISEAPSKEVNWKLAVSRVVYEFDKTSGKVHRFENDEMTKKLPGKFKKVTFKAKGRMQKGLVVQYSADNFQATLPLTMLVRKHHHRNWVRRVSVVSES